MSVARRATQVGVLVSALVLGVASPALAGWEAAAGTAVRVDKVCPDGIRLAVGLLDFAGEGNPSEPDQKPTRLMVAKQHPVLSQETGEYVLEDVDILVDKGILLGRLPAPLVIAGDPENPFDDLTLTHRKQGRYRFTELLPVGTTVALSPEGFSPSVTVFDRVVRNCRVFPKP
jgi:hypothetical protein